MRVCTHVWVCACARVQSNTGSTAVVGMFVQAKFAVTSESYVDSGLSVYRGISEGHALLPVAQEHVTGVCSLPPNPPIFLPHRRLLAMAVHILVTTLGGGEGGR